MDNFHEMFSFFLSPVNDNSRGSLVLFNYEESNYNNEFPTFSLSFSSVLRRCANSSFMLHPLMKISSDKNSSGTKGGVNFARQGNY